MLQPTQYWGKAMSAILDSNIVFIIALCFRPYRSRSGATRTPPSRAGQSLNRHFIVRENARSAISRTTDREFLH